MYLFWPFVGAVFLLFFFYRKTVNHFYGTFIFFYMCLVPGILVMTIDENVLSKTDQNQIRIAYIAEFVLYRLLYLFAIGWASLFAAQWAKSKTVHDPADEVTADVVDIDIDDFDEKAEETGSHRHLAV
jgi:heme A synthase